MDFRTRQQLLEIFAGPVSTGTVLTRSSNLSMDLASKVADEMDISGVFGNLGAIMAKAYVDELERRKLAARDATDCRMIAAGLARRVSKELFESEAFWTKFFEHIKERGGWQAYLKAPSKA